MYVCVGDQWDSHEESEEGCGGATLPQRSPALGQQAEGRGQISATAAHVYTLCFNICLQPSCMYVCMYVFMYVLERMYVWIYDRSYDLSLYICTYVCKHDRMYWVRSFTEHKFFFSLTSDVTVTQQNIAKFQPKQLADPIWTRADHRR